MKKIDLTQSEIRVLLEAINNAELKSKNLSKINKADLVDKLAFAYVKNFDFNNDLNTQKLKSFKFSNITQDILKLIIHLLSILTGYPENSISLNTNLDNIGITPIKRETLRRRINNYLTSLKVQKFITPSEMNKCDTVKNLYELVVTKIN